MIETTKLPLQPKVIEWTCINAECQAGLKGLAGDAQSRGWDHEGLYLEFDCPHCGWRTPIHQ